MIVVLVTLSYVSCLSQTKVFLVGLCFFDTNLHVVLVILQADIMVFTSQHLLIAYSFIYPRSSQGQVNNTLLSSSKHNLSRNTKVSIHGIGDEGLSVSQEQLKNAFRNGRPSNTETSDI